MPQQRPPLRALQLGLSGLAGLLDATGFLIAQGYFVSFMSGNTTQLGVNLLDGIPQVLLPAGLIACFLGGVTAGAAIGWTSERRPRSTLLAISLALVSIAAAAYEFGSTLGFLAPAAFAMGLVNNVFLRDDGSSAGVTYMTGALVRIGQNFAASLLGQRNRIKPGYGLLWLCLLGGAILGTWLHTLPGATGPLVAAGANALLLLLAWRTEKREN
ncbi:YoaK family protein [Qipengyuania spongiae]|uniref:DUF1275 family protein n=1 Tax=Qipengyuania spongiae TaxID=2909673 RepID=A0ABY5T3V7_9SPHN|nr:DUF1275 family protein [Qipengyuania spongiae]UVI40021.1 DUF1275 family protein [Qipengyuania spongiae]